MGKMLAELSDRELYSEQDTSIKRRHKKIGLSAEIVIGYLNYGRRIEAVKVKESWLSRNSVNNATGNI